MWVACYRVPFRAEIRSSVLIVRSPLWLFTASETTDTDKTLRTDGSVA